MFRASWLFQRFCNRTQRRASYRREQYSPFVGVAEMERRELLAADTAAAIADVAAITATSDASETPVQEIGPAVPGESTRDLGETAHQTAHVVRAPREIVFIDPHVSDQVQLSEGVSPDAEVVLLDDQRDGLTQIRDALRVRGTVSAIHLVAHGDSGEIKLAGQVLDAFALKHNALTLREWRSYLTEDADILVYGCSTGDGEKGAHWMEVLAELTGADIAASTDRTGGAARGADWELERQVGSVETLIAFTERAQQNYNSTLPITIRAAGATGTENMALLIDGQAVANFTNVGGNFNQRQFQTFTYNNATPIAANRIQVAFTNDLFTPTVNRDLRVDSITIDGRLYETEATNVFSTGTWEPGTGITPGFKKSEILNASGSFLYAEKLIAGKTTITVLAAGETNQESMQLLIDGNVVQTWNNVGGNANTGQFVPYTYQAEELITANRIRVKFINDDVVNGKDRNLRIDRIHVDSQVYQTEASDVYSTGSYRDSDGITPGFRTSEYLHADGYFQFDALNPPDTRPTTRLPNFSDFTLINDLQTNGTATRLGKVLQLTPSEGGLASVFYKDPFAVNASTSFQTQFQFRIRDGQGTNGADGFVFMLQNSATGLNTLSTIEGRGLGYWQTDRSLGIEFDTYKNTWDPDSNHISVFANGNMDAPLATQSVAIDLNSGQPINAWVDYNGVTNELTVFLGTSSTKPLLPVLKTEVNLPQLVGDKAYLGFSAATGGLVNRHEILSWQFSDSPPPASNPAGMIGLEDSTIEVRENAGSAAVTVVRGFGAQGTVTVDYRTIANSATAGVDYVARQGTLVFAPGEVRKTVTIPLLNDSSREPVETFTFTIDNVTGGGTLLAPRTATVTITDDDAKLPVYSSFANATNLRLNGSASINGSNLQLTPSGGGYATAYYVTPLIVTPETSFETAFQFRIRDGQGPAGADGLTWMLQNSPAGLSALSSGPGEGLGYAGITQSLAIEFDTYKNAFDINDNHISVLANGNMILPLAVRSAPLDLNGGGVVNVWIDYNGNGDQLSVYISSLTTKPDEAWLTANVDLAALVGNQAYLGFSAATGGLVNRHEVLNWTFSTNTPPLTLPDPTPEALAQVVASGFNLPTAIAFSPLGNNVYVAEKSGVVKVVRQGQTQLVPFIDISRQTNDHGDRGLLSIAVHPDFASNPYVYLLYTYDPPEVFDNRNDLYAGPDQQGNRAGRLIRVTADAATNYTTAIAGSEVVLLGSNSTWNNFNAFVDSTIDFDEPPGGILSDGTNVRDFIASDSSTHSVADLKFGPDGALYVSIGDGASYNQVDPRGVRVLDVNNLSGKVLRIDPLTGAGLPDNPYFNGDAQANRSKVYYLGLRNPFRIAVDPTSGKVYAGDVGWAAWEEINTGAPGANFGWPYFEGGNGNNLQTAIYRDLPQASAYYASNPQVVPSLLALSHGADGINAMIIGDLYTGSAYGTEYVGDIFFNDLGQGIVRHASLDSEGNVSSVGVFALNATFVVQIVQGPDGHLYYVDLDDGTIGRWNLS